MQHESADEMQVTPAAESGPRTEWLLQLHFRAPVSGKLLPITYIHTTFFGSHRL